MLFRSMRRFEDLCRFEDETVLSITVVGGGPTGVEMAGAIAELKNGPLANDHRGASSHIKVNIVEAGPRLLPSFSPLLSSRTKSDLEKLGVNVITDSIVKEVKPRQIIFKDGNKIGSEVTRCAVRYFKSSRMIPRGVLLIRIIKVAKED